MVERLAVQLECLGVMSGPFLKIAALRRIRERHRATLWLLGQARDWDAIDLNL